VNCDRATRNLHKEPGIAARGGGRTRGARVELARRSVAMSQIISELPVMPKFPVLSCPEGLKLHPDLDRQIIIAGTDDDVTAADLFDWVLPVLTAIPAGRWSGCELEWKTDNKIVVRYRSSGSNMTFSLDALGADPEFAAVSALIPRSQVLVMIVLGDYAAQVISLLDGIARWLSIHEAAQSELAPVKRLLEKLEAMARSTA
jgi:hypothetical protein